MVWMTGASMGQEVITQYHRPQVHKSFGSGSYSLDPAALGGRKETERMEAGQDYGGVNMEYEELEVQFHQEQNPSESDYYDYSAPEQKIKEHYDYDGFEDQSPPPQQKVKMTKKKPSLMNDGQKQMLQELFQFMRSYNKQKGANERFF